MDRTPKFLTFVLVLLIVAGALAFRLPRLGERPMHGDEANQAVKSGILFDEGVYRYDPHEHHGPTLYYLTLPFLWLGGAGSFAETNEVQFRLLPAVFGALLVLLLAPLRRDLGAGALFWAGVFTAVSPAMVYYSRYYVQEMLLVAFAFAAIVAGRRYAHTQRLGWAIAAGVCLGLVHATKETCVLIYAAMVAGLAGTWALARWRGEIGPEIFRPVRPVHLLAGLIAGAAVSVTLYSSCFTHARGPLDSILTYSTYMVRSEGTGSTGIHDKPWYYYLHTLLYTYRTAGPRWTEALIVGLALVGILVSLVKRGPAAEQNGSPPPCTGAGPGLHLLRFLAIYTVVLTATFSAVPYKTPWNLLAFLHGMIVMAGVGAAALMRAGRVLPVRVALCVLLGVGACHLGWQSYLGNFRYAADVRNPYVYAHTSTALLRLVRRVEDIAALHPGGHGMHINIIKPDADYWPLPWYLRAYSRVGYWARFPQTPDAPIIIADPRLQPQLDEALKGQYQVEYYALRPGVLLLAYIRADLWDAFIAARS